MACVTFGLKETTMCIVSIFISEHLYRVRLTVELYHRYTAHVSLRINKLGNLWYREADELLRSRVHE